MTHTAIRLTQSRHFKYSNLYRRLIVKRWILVGCSQIELFQSAFAAETLPCAWPEKASHSEEPWANAHRCVKPHLYDHRISTCFLYGCVGTCWWEFGDPGHEKAMFPRCFFLFFWILDRCFAKIICILGASDVIEESPAIFGMPPWAACNMCHSHLCNGRTLGRT